MQFPILVISDLHLGLPASSIRDPEQLAPLFSGFRTVIFNGDTAELLWVRNRDSAQKQLEKVGQVCISAGADPVFLSGNHDPIASSAHHLDLFGGRVLVTHGDILFHELAPWSRDSELLGGVHTRILENLEPEALSDFEKRLFAAKEASIALEMHEPKAQGTRLAQLAMILRESWPPWRALRILHFWRVTPDRADQLAARFRPQAEFVLIGHTHRAGIWRRGGRTIINTGSFLPCSGKCGVVLHEDEIEVRAIRKRAGQFHLGRRKARFPIPAKDVNAQPEATRVLR